MIKQEFALTKDKEVVDLADKYGQVCTLFVRFIEEVRLQDDGEVAIKPRRFDGWPRYYQFSDPDCIAAIIQWWMDYRAPRN